MSKKRQRQIKKRQKAFDKKYPIKNVKYAEGSGTPSEGHPDTLLDKGHKINEPQNPPVVPVEKPKSKISFDMSRLKSLLNTRKKMKEVHDYYGGEAEKFYTPGSTPPFLTSSNSDETYYTPKTLSKEPSTIFTSYSSSFPSQKSQKIQYLRKTDPRRYEEV